MSETQPEQAPRILALSVFGFSGRCISLNQWKCSQPKPDSSFKNLKGYIILALHVWLTTDIHGHKVTKQNKEKQKQTNKQHFLCPGFTNVLLVSFLLDIIPGYVYMALFWVTASNWHSPSPLMIPLGGKGVQNTWNICFETHKLTIWGPPNCSW